MKFDKIRDSKIINTRGIIWVSIGLILIFLVLESFIHVFIFHEGTLFSQIFDFHEIWMRMLIGTMFIIFTIYAYITANKEKRAEEITKKAYAELDKIFQTAGDGMCVIDKNFNLLQTNDTFSLLSGVSKDKAVSKKCYEVFPVNVCHTPNCPLTKISKGEERFECEVEKEYADGRKISAILTATPLLGPDGKLIEIVENYKDITDIKNTQKALQKTNDELEFRVEQLQKEIEERHKVETEIKGLEQQMEFILSVTKTGLNIIDQDLNIQYIDPGWRKVYGDPNNKKCYEYFMGRDDVCIDCSALKAFEKKSIVISEHILSKENNRPIEVSTIPFRNDNGEWLVAQIKLDITERKKAALEKEDIQAKLRQAQKLDAVGRLAGGVAHDFNNLLTTIIGYTEILLSGLKRNDPLYTYAETIKRISKLAANLTRQLLAFSRGQILKPRVIDFSTMIKDMGKIFQRTIGEDIEFLTSFEPGLDRVKADLGQIEQVILNLVINARDSMPDGGKLSIKVKNVIIDKKCLNVTPNALIGKFVCIMVEDTGIGMSKDIANQIFEPFFSTKGPGKGIGLGLSTVYGIVKQHGGWINVYSEPGHGSIFKVYFPSLTMVQENEEEEENEISLQEFRGNGQRILIVEDDKEVLEFNTNMLHANGYIPFPAKNAEEALEIFERERGEFALVLSDVVLPGKDGVQLVDDLLLEKPDLPVLLTSGYIDQKSQWQVIEKKGYPFLQKPYSLVELLRTIKETLKSG